MDGVYVAKPEAVASLDVPPGWNSKWPFPGPYPPGYTPDLSYVLVAQPRAQISRLTGYPITSPSVRLVDHDTYETLDPGGSVTWTATLNGETRLLYEQGVYIPQAEVYSAYALGAGIYSAFYVSSVLNFAVQFLASDQVDDIVVVQATSTTTVFGYTLTTTRDYLVI